MLTLDLTPSEMKQLEQASKQAGMTVSQYVLSKLFADMDKPTTMYDLAMQYNGVDVSDIEIDSVEKLPSTNRFMELD